jgi:hypothetical protein
MTAMVVLYVRSLGQPLGALSTVVPGEVPPLGQASTFLVALPIADPLSPPTMPPAPPPPLGPPLPRPVTVDRDDVRLAAVEAEFDDPLEVFQWRVVTTTGPDGTEQHRLDRLGSGRVKVTRQGSGTTANREIALEVPRLGSEPELDYEVRNEAGVKKTSKLDFGGTGDTRRDTVLMPDTEAVVVLVEGYAPVFVKKL